MAVKQFHFNRYTVTRAQATHYFGLNGHASTSATEANGTHPWSVAGTFRNLAIKHNGALASGRSSTLTLRINGVDTALSVTVTDGGALTASNTSDSVHVNVGDAITIKRTLGGGVTSGSDDISFCFEFDSDNAGESGHAAHHAGNGGNSGSTCYNYPHHAAHLWSLTSGLMPDLIAVGGVMDRFDATLSAAPGSGKSYTVAWVKNGVTQDGSGGTVDTRLTISDLATSGTWTGSLPLSPGDTVYLVKTAQGSPTAAAIAFSHRFVSTVDGYANLLIKPGTAYDVSLPYAGAPVQGHSGTEANVEQLAPVSGMLLGGMHAAITAAHSGTSLTFSVRVNQAAPASPPSVVLGSADVYGGDGSGNTATLVYGDTWAIHTVKNGGLGRHSCISFGQQAPPSNEAPVVNAGPDQTITLPVNFVSLCGTVTDDGVL